MKKFGSKSGFTLVELIVVIAILGILAGIAVPAYSGYIKKANDAADYSQLDAIKTAVVFAYTDKHVKDTPFNDIQKITVTNGSVSVLPAETTGPLDISSYYKIADFSFKNTDHTSAEWTPTDGWKLLPETPAAGNGK